MDLIYKVFRENEWTEFERSRIFTGSADDLRDGYVHFSSRTQLARTIATYFSDVDVIIIASVSTDEFIVDLKWEPSTGGKLYPHLYAPLPYSALKKTIKLQRNDGEFDLAALETDA